MPPRTLVKKAAAKKPAPAAAVRDDLVAPPVFARILPKNVGGHRDDGKAVAKRLKSWSEEKDDARVTLSDGHGETHYTFPTRVFGPDASQEELFNEVAGPLLERFLHPSDPQSAFLFAYGQTGTGKTHTIMGPEESWDEVRHSKWGLFPRIVDAVLTTMRGRDASHAFSCTLSAVEFYFCQGFDLLDDHAQVDVRDGDLLGRKQVEVKTLADVLKVLAAVREHRTTASTKMNPALKAAGGKEKDNKTHGGSSRSHCVLHCILRIVDRCTRDVKTVSFGTMDLAGAERPKSNDNGFASVMDAVLTYWRDPSQVRPCAQAAIINMELAALRSSVVQAAEAHRRGRRVGAPTQLGTAAVNYMTDVFAGRCHVANIVTLSQAPKCGWETWFACTYAEDVAKLRMPDDLRSAKGKNIGKWNMQCAAMNESAKAALERTPPKGHPSSKFYMRRKVEARHWAQEAKIVAALAAKVAPGAEA